MTNDISLNPRVADCDGDWHQNFGVLFSRFMSNIQLLIKNDGSWMLINYYIILLQTLIPKFRKVLFIITVKMMDYKS